MRAGFFRRLDLYDYLFMGLNNVESESNLKRDANEGWLPKMGISNTHSVN